MNSRHLVDTKLAAFLDLIPSTSLMAESLATNRASTAAMVTSLWMTQAAARDQISAIRWALKLYMKE
jgi:hypothetical protein